MGHQARLLTTPADIRLVERVLKERADVTFLHSRSACAEPRILAGLESEAEGGTWLFYFLVRTADLDSVVLKHVPAQGYWRVDAVESAVVEFTRSYFDGKVLREGRIWYTEWRYDEGGRRVEKVPSFATWAKSTFTAIKRALRHKEGVYIGPGAEEWMSRQPSTAK